MAQYFRMSLSLVSILVLFACGDASRPQSAEKTLPAANTATAAAAEADNQSVIEAALADPGRPEEDRSRDETSKPGGIMAFAGFQPGDVVADIGASRGYYTRILSGIVGEDGHVYAFNAREVADMFFKDGNPSDALADKYTNVSSVVAPFSTPVFEQPLDGVIIVKFYHDVHYERFAADAATLNRTLYEQLKPGGTYLVIDHAAEEGSGLRDVGKLHRIDAQQVMGEVLAAGFEFVGETDLLANPLDDRSKSVFDPGVRGMTDRFVYLFRKPR